MKFPCPNCNANIKVSEEWYGMPLKCPHDRCGATITVPTPNSIAKRGRGGLGAKLEDFFSGLFSKKKGNGSDE
ncbi:hypothetical protein VSU19_20685 [Verrucomicrobiales bacterium BCK34]|nr:hypothetical protein [Verrucomicrobiales bacterium BCK34]